MSLRTAPGDVMVLATESVALPGSNPGWCLDDMPHASAAARLHRPAPDQEAGRGVLRGWNGSLPLGGC